MAKASENQFPKITWAESSAPSTPSTGLAYTYVKTDGKLYLKDDTGAETDLTATGSSPLTTKGDVYTYTTTDARLAVGTDGYVLTADSAQAAGIKWAAASASSVPGWVGYLNARQSGETAGTYDDFFDNGSVGGTTVTSSGAQTLTEQYDILSVKVTTAQTAGWANCQLQAATPTAGASVYIETAFQLHQRSGGVAHMGVCMTDGTAAGSNIALAGWYYSSSNTLFNYQTHGTINNYGGAGSGLQFDTTNPDVLYARLYYSASNTFYGEWSPDGVSWSRWGLSDLSKTMTPSHIGVYWQHTSGNVPTISNFYYFRDET